ncbi:B3 domain-containing protein [Hordeum vulgare]|nr:B3 domain-containing protein [Hordeum vulgare]
MAESNSYEEQHRRQIEENRRKLEEQRVHHLSAAVREAAARPKPKPIRQTLSLLLLPCLRSSISFSPLLIMSGVASDLANVER